VNDTTQQVSAGQYKGAQLRHVRGGLPAYEKKTKGYHRRLGPMLDAAPVKSCLDVGCSGGLLCYYLRKRGISDVVGVDGDADMVEIARQHVDAEFVVGDATHYLQTCNRRFDFISLLNVLEHVPREKAVEFLAAVRGTLNDGRFAVVRAPNLSCLAGSGHFYRSWTHVLPLTETSLQWLAAEAGFSRVELCNQFRMQSFKGKMLACVNWLVHKAAYKLVGGRCPTVFYRNLYARLYR